jgi:transketolase
MVDAELDELSINTIRFLAVDAVQKANAGHPGAPMGAAPMAYVLWDRFLKHNPADPTWPDRDRFILSAGHASTLLYALLHLTGYDLPLEELKRFRQWGSQTPGHPEYGLTAGVEVTTGPLGQGFANGVGMAMAEKWMAEHYNRPNHLIVDHYTYGIVSDGDLMEGISSEAASLAGTLRLGKLIYLYDDNNISIEGDTDAVFTEDVGQRFLAYGWHIVGPIDGLDTSAVDAAIRMARAELDRPTLIICQTIIGYGSPHKAGKAVVHGEPLGEEEVRITKENLGWPYSEPFAVPHDVQTHLRLAEQRGKLHQNEWEVRIQAYYESYPAEARLLEESLKGELPPGWDDGLEQGFEGEGKPIATREASGRVMNIIAQRVHALMGGSADLAPSTKTLLIDHGDYSSTEYDGHNLHFGVREHAMGGIANGLAIHGGPIPYTATFLIFSDYMRPSIRLAALMGIRVIYVFTHDSIGLGEDGPTHQPIEQLLGLRGIPNLFVMRPADATETAEAWRVALERRNGPTALALSRQALPILDRTALAHAQNLKKGGYTLWEAAAKPDVILIGTGSEVHIALQAGKSLKERKIMARVVSMPCWELFDAQPAEYRNAVLPKEVKARVAIEAGTPLGWEHYVGLDGVVIGLPHFGASAPSQDLYREFDLNPTHMMNEAIRLFNSLKN